MTSSPVLAILKLQHEKVRISVKNKVMSKIFTYVPVVCSTLNHAASDGKLGMAWERGYLHLEATGKFSLS